MLGETFHSRCVCHITSADIPYHSNRSVSKISCPLKRSHLGVFSWLWWKHGLIVVTCSYICNGCMPVRAVCKTSLPWPQKEALWLWRSLLERLPPAPESRVRDPLEARTSYDGVDPGGLHIYSLCFFLSSTFLFKSEIKTVLCLKIKWKCIVAT